MWRRQQTTISSLQTIQRTTRLKICMMSMSKAAPDALLTRYSSRPTVHEPPLKHYHLERNACTELAVVFHRNAYWLRSLGGCCELQIEDAITRGNRCR